jgi:hypothetical protein
MQEWTMNTLKTVDKDLGTQNGQLPNGQYFMMLRQYFDGYMQKEFDKIGELVKSGSKDYDLLFRVAHS